MEAASRQMAFRFAPSPNGMLHLGHARSALLNFDAACRSGGRFLLRIENIDRERCRPEYEAALLHDLAWLGLEWEQPVRRQSEHFCDYSAALGKLGGKGLLYPCFCSRGQIARSVARQLDWTRDPDGVPLYRGTCRGLDASHSLDRLALREPATMRLDMAKALASLPLPLHWLEFGEGEIPMRILAEPERWGDVVLARKDVPTSYHLAVVVDDAVQGVTDVVRGTDLYWATSVHRVLQDQLGLSAPAYHHHSLLLDAGGQKLSKSLASNSLAALRSEGATPADIRRLAGVPKP